MRRQEKNNVWFILLLLGSWLAVYLAAKYWGMLNFSLVIFITDKGVPVSFVHFLPFCCCAIFGFILALLYAPRKNRSERNSACKLVVSRTIVWAVPAVVFALWHIMYLFITFIPRPLVYDATFNLDFEICCGVIVGVVIGSIRNTLYSVADNRGLFFFVLKAIIYSAVYYTAFCLFSIWVQGVFFSIYGPVDYGFGAYWATAAGIIFFGLLFGLFFRLSGVSIREKREVRSGKVFVWVIILIIAIVFMGIMWEVLTKTYMPSFPSPTGRIPDIAVIWMFALGYLLGIGFRRELE